ncbi:MAG: T9SS type A sorting domain-containing protein [Flavobacteriales bacterium]|nr:T9SS type A sorting domain-containing protein [Flavobacteriales bacterium]
MKKLYIVLFLFTTVFTRAQIVNIPDANFKAKLLQASSSNQIASSETPSGSAMTVSSYNAVDTNGDGQIQVTEAQAIKWLKIFLPTATNTSLVGIEAFTNLEYLDCSASHITTSSNLPPTNFPISNLTNLRYLNYGANAIVNAPLSNLTNLKHLLCASNYIVTLPIGNLTNLETLYCGANQITSLPLTNLTNLMVLSCGVNSISTLDVSNLSNLRTLECQYSVSSLNLTQNTLLTRLICNNNNITSLNLSQNLALTELNCSSCPLTSLDVSQNTALTKLNCSNIPLNTLNVSQNTALTELNCSSNLLSSLNISQNTALQTFFCSNNYFTTLDLSLQNSLYTLVCDNNQLASINIKNNTAIGTLDFSNNPTIEYICADNTELYLVQQLIDQYGYTDTCTVSSYCSFTPSGTFYTLQGKTQFDGDNNGCNAGDLPYPNMKFNISNGSTLGRIISDITGNYIIPVLAGTYTYTPIIENPAYFNISPPNAVVTFPTTSSPFTQDFCLTPNGIHHDLEVKIIPLNVSRPGFDTYYKIFYKNKGNQTENTTLNFTYDDTVIDLLNASESPSSQSSGMLSWNLGTILPLLSGEIVLRFNLNTPMETPALNAGDTLTYTASFNGLLTDDTPTDNTVVYNDPIVNSYDPNDKTCLEGSTIDPSQIGQYVNYMIRFENTGTYPAQNIVVKDFINTTKFDINTLQMVNTSHSCYTRVNGNMVEFIFENINLPFDDASNDGYVVFKIKTRSSLTVGSTISNNASIYFDYNFPIITNTATSTFTALNNSDFDFEDEFTLYPIPAENQLLIAAKNNLEINSVAIYNLLGQLIYVETDPTDAIDVSNLKSGNYLIKTATNKGMCSRIFVKK